MLFKKVLLTLASILTITSMLLGLASCDKEKLGTGACEYAETRDITDREIYYVEMCIEDYGRLVILLDATTAPITVANFLGLVESGFYDGLTLHRIIENFMVQGGDPKANGQGGSENTIEGEFLLNGHANDISHKYGVISMARSQEYNSASSQFFICNADASRSLDHSYAAFGYVVQGMSVIDEITKDFFPITDAYQYYLYYQMTGDANYYYYWNQYGNGAISNKDNQPVIKYIKIIDNWG